MGYQIHDRTLRPDPERVKTLLDIPVPKSKKELSSAIGLFTYYGKWLPCFSCKVKPLVKSQTFALNENAVCSFYQLKSELADATLASVDENAPFTLEINASDVAVSAVLQQNGRPLPFGQEHSIQMRNVMQALKRKLQLLLKWSGNGCTIYCLANSL